MNSKQSCDLQNSPLAPANTRRWSVLISLIRWAGRALSLLLRDLKSDAATILQGIKDVWNGPEETPIRGRSILPIPAQKRAPAAVKKEKKPTSVFDIDVQYNDRGNPVSGTFGFYAASTEADRKGAVRHCTGYDKQELEDRGLSGGNKVQAQNEKCKALWFAGETVAAAMAEMKLSDSWIEKRFAAFSAALSAELSK